MSPRAPADRRGQRGSPLRRHASRAAIAALALTAAGCGGEGAGGGTPSPCPYPPDGAAPVHRVDDPGGWLSGVPVRHVREAATFGAAAPDADSGVVLRDVGDVEVGPGDTVWVADSGTGRIRAFGTGGDTVRSLGGRGTRPGRFLDLLELGVGPGDTLRAFDLRLVRETRFALSGGLLGTSPVPGAAGAGPSPDPAYDARGRLYRLGWEDFASSVRAALGDRSEGVVRGEVTLQRWTAGDSAWTDLATVPSPEVYVRDEGPLDAPFAARPLWDAAPGGGVWYADSREYLLTRLSAAGDTACRVRVDVERPRVTEEDRRAFLRAEDVVPFSHVRQRRMQEIRRRMPIPERRPALAGLAAAADGGVWVRPAPDHWGVRPDTVTWHAFSPAGEPEARVRLPGDVRVMWVGRDVVLGVRRIPSGLDHVDRVVRLEVVGAD